MPSTPRHVPSTTTPSRAAVNSNSSNRSSSNNNNNNNNISPSRMSVNAVISQLKSRSVPLSSVNFSADDIAVFTAIAKPFMLYEESGLRVKGVSYTDMVSAVKSETIQWVSLCVCVCFNCVKMCVCVC